MIFYSNTSKNKLISILLSSDFRVKKKYKVTSIKCQKLFKGTDWKQGIGKNFIAKLKGCVRTINSNILIVEDEVKMIIAIDLKIRLENLGYYVLGIAVNGKDAIKKTGEKNPDLVLMDILLNGEIDGIETAQQIRKLMIYHLISNRAYDNSNLRKTKISKSIWFHNKTL